MMCPMTLPNATEAAQTSGNSLPTFRLPSCDVYQRGSNDEHHWRENQGIDLYDSRTPDVLPCIAALYGTGMAARFFSLSCSSSCRSRKRGGAKGRQNVWSSFRRGRKHK